jgi:hypothetical protein
MTRLFAVKEAHYTNGQDQERSIAGVPPNGYLYFGEYTGSPSQAAKKAFTGLQKHMKKYHNDDAGGGRRWFPGYNPSNPPVITFMMVDVADPDTPLWYTGKRIPAHQGNRIIENSDGRIRKYKWDSKVQRLDQPRPTA